MIAEFESGAALFNYRIKEVLRVIDGDTLYVILDLGFNFTMTDYIRLYGVDTPELSGADKARGQEAKLFTTNWIKGRQLFLNSQHYDDREKYGRILGTVYRDGDNVSLTDALITAGLVKRTTSGDPQAGNELG